MRSRMIAVVLAVLGGLVGGDAGAAQLYLWSGPVVEESILGVLTGDRASLTVLFDPAPPADLDPSPTSGIYDVGEDGGLIFMVEMPPLDPMLVTCLAGALIVLDNHPEVGDALVVSGETCFDDTFAPAEFVGALISDPSALTFTSDVLLPEYDRSMFAEASLLLDLGARGRIVADVEQMLATPEPSSAAVAALLALGGLAIGRRDGA